MNIDNLDDVIFDILKKKKFKKFKNVIIIFIIHRSELYLDKAINTLRLFNADVVECVNMKMINYYHNGKGLKFLKPNKFLKVERDNIYIRTGGLVIK